MEGKKIEKTLELGGGLTLLKLDDGTYASIKVIDPEIPADVVEEFLAEDKPAAKTEKKVEKKTEPEKEKEPEKEDDDELTWDAINEMNLKGLKKLIKEKNLLADPDDFEDDDEGLKKEIAEELDIEIPKKKSKKEPEPEPEGEDYTWDDLVEMDFEELSDLCKESKTDTDPDDFDEDDVDKFRRAIATEFDIEVPKKKK